MDAQPTRQFRDPRSGDDVLWLAIQANQKEIADTRLSTAQSFGVVSAQLATLQATVNLLVESLKGKQDREEDKTYRAWQNDRYSQVSPGQQQTNRYNRNIDMQTLFMLLTLIVAVLALLGVRL